MSEENLVNFITTIAKIAQTTAEAHKAHKSNSTRKRRWWVRPVNITRDEDTFYKTCVQQLKEKDEENFFKATRMNVGSFNLLLELVKEKLERFSKRKAIDVETRLFVAIMYLAQGCNIQIPVWAYKMGISTVRKIVYETCDAIWDAAYIFYNE